MSEAHLKRLAAETSRLLAAEQLQLPAHLADEMKLVRPSFLIIQDIVKEVSFRAKTNFSILLCVFSRC